ncbi:hypothetical protein [Spirosoma pollinicola]|uniref:Uncharacterized protein n=1 Tax=Spirosoma pollinicola TaxID=2057025 RepID=A0A2K8ZBX9_9BACT|nr:hypothetical protein [Spirosoma pollinicola]AUD07366.1 hypothetical protein CWM47_18270 [Spirosoma pollinicola]
MSSQAENLKVIFFDPEANSKAGSIVADAYFSFVPTFNEGDEINMTLSRKEATDATVHDPIGHKTHRILKTDWVMMIDEQSKNALATLVVSVSKIAQQADVIADFPTVVATHA